MALLPISQNSSLPKKNLPLIDAEIEVRKLINYWNGTLHKEYQLKVENLGTFFLNDSKLLFSGARTENLSPDFFGLEQINISEIKKPKKIVRREHAEKSYKTNNSVWWVLPLIIGIGAITYFGITQPESIFGKKSFGKLPVQKPVQKETNVKAKPDSTVVKADSAAINSENKLKNSSEISSTK